MGLGIGIGVGVGVGSQRGGAAAAPQVNLLLSSNQFGQSAWMRSDVLVLTDHRVVSLDVDAYLRQIAASAVSTGAEQTRTANISGSLSRFELTGTYDGLPYTFSAELQDNSGGAGNTALGMRLDRFGGGLRCQFEDVTGTADFLVYRAQLEQAAAFTTYHDRGGT